MVWRSGDRIEMCRGEILGGMLMCYCWVLRKGILVEVCNVRRLNRIGIIMGEWYGTLETTFGASSMY